MIILPLQVGYHSRRVSCSAVVWGGNGMESGVYQCHRAQVAVSGVIDKTICFTNISQSIRSREFSLVSVSETLSKTAQASLQLVTKTTRSSQLVNTYVQSRSLRHIRSELLPHINFANSLCRSSGSEKVLKVLQNRYRYGLSGSRKTSVMRIRAAFLLLIMMLESTWMGLRD